jgi:hypothetical protein
MLRARVPVAFRIMATKERGMVLVTLWAVRVGLLVALGVSLMAVARLRRPQTIDAS